MYNRGFSHKVVQCKKCGRDCNVGYHDDIFCDECIETIKAEYLSKYPFKIGQPVYTMILGSKNAAYTVRQYTLHKIEFRNWFFWNEDESKLNLENLESHFKITLKNDKKGYIDRTIDEIYNTEEDCFNANKDAIKTHMINVAKKQVLQAVEKQLSDGFETSLDDDFIKQLINKTIQDGNMEPKNVLAVEKSQPKDEQFTLSIKSINLCHDLIKRNNRTINKIVNVFEFVSAPENSELFNRLNVMCCEIGVNIMKINTRLNQIYSKNSEDFINWIYTGETSFEKWLEQYEEDK